MPQASEKPCNRVIFKDDCALGCELPMGHDGPHQHTHEGPRGGAVTIVFEKGFARLQIDRLQHMIPDGKTCWFADGRACPFLAFLGMDDEFRDYACYLSTDMLGGWCIYPTERHKACR